MHLYVAYAWRLHRYYGRTSNSVGFKTVKETANERADLLKKKKIDTSVMYFFTNV